MQKDGFLGSMILSIGQEWGSLHVCLLNCMVFWCIRPSDTLWEKAMLLDRTHHAHQGGNRRDTIFYCFKFRQAWLPGLFQHLPLSTSTHTANCRTSSLNFAPSDP
ncbi:hypothetical protein VTN00DRAFT_7066 [Thermoascus crustaceus]|uniref:uncharacterized protein n=1 Tax=Thermoascus crustaceus TaxID=5088 RepID=UPI003743D4B4